MGTPYDDNLGECAAKGDVGRDVREFTMFKWYRYAGALLIGQMISTL